MGARIGGLCTRGPVTAALRVMLERSPNSYRMVYSSKALRIVCAIRVAILSVLFSSLGAIHGVTIKYFASKVSKAIIRGNTASLPIFHHINK
jgi:hypothetical protein